MVAPALDRARTRMNMHIARNAVACTVTRPTRQETARGGWTAQSTTVYSGKCHKVTAGRQRPFEQMQNEQTTGRVDLAVLFPVGTDIRIQDRIVIGGASYEVTGFPETGTMNAGLEVDCRRIRA